MVNTLSQKIQEWLNGSQNFIVGRVLYNQLGRDQNLKALFRSHGETAVSKDLLKKALEGLLKKPVIVEKKFDRITDEMPRGNDRVTIALNDEWKPVYSRMKYLAALLDKYETNNSPEAVEYRRLLAHEILELEQKVMFIWHKRDYYLQCGTLPQVKQQEKGVPTDPIDLAKHIENIKKNIRKNRAKMQQEGANAIYAQLYTKYLDEFKQITGKDYKEKIKASASAKNKPFIII